MTDLPRLPKNCTASLHAAGITSLEKCAEWTRADVGMLSGVGPRMLDVLDICMREVGLAFRQPEISQAQSRPVTS